MTEKLPIRLTWNIHWACNYRCSYCFFDGRWMEYAQRNAHRSADEWERIWTRIHELYGRTFVTITGGEPFIYPDFLEILRRLSRLHWPVNVSTNSSVGLDEFAAAADPEKVSLSLSFHPQYQLIGEFTASVRSLRERKVNLGCLNFVAYPPFIPDIPGYAEKLAAMGESLKVIPFVGGYRGRNYPDGYTREEKRALGLDSGWVEGKRRKGRLCTAGHRSALILPDGAATRCGQVGDTGIFGSVFDPAFRLQERPMPCEAELCPCDEWKVIPDEKPPEEAGAYLP
ncbi:MAG: hypothetical protein A2X36_04315 [Elusimicrobia bacterium GWA2_69_24]|nr:MAG: hypothetical protein A2X36_04315 [Elusimicrobia bacterium GWA2_69_24]HBL16281.1 hypothetical protein [Elusimicrobiota bacterium]